MMVTRVVAIFPAFENGQILESLRQKFHPLAPHLAGHITVVFPFDSSLPLEVITTHLQEQSREIAPFYLKLQGISAQSHRWVFLNIVDGLEPIIKLHTRYYSGLLAGYRAWLPFTTYQPHLTIGAIDDSAAFEEVMRDLQQMNTAFESYVDRVTIYRIERNGSRPIEADVRLGAPQG